MLRINGLCVSYGHERVLDEVNLDVNSGEVLTLVGPNGAGKSTLIRAVSGVIPIQAGAVHIDGIQLARLSTTARARCLAVVPQARSLPPAFTVYQTVLLGRTPYLSWLGHAALSDHQIVKRALAQVELEEMAERRIGELSGGEQQRVLLGRALAQDSPVL